MNDLFRGIVPKVPHSEPQPESLKQLRTKFSLDPEFFAQLILRLKEKEKERRGFFALLRRPKHPPSGWVARETPQPTFTNLGERIISELIETVFWASLERDEGRSLRFSVAYRCRTETDSEPDRTTDHDIVFETPLDFTVKELKRLGPAIGRDVSLLISADSCNVLKITGISSDPFLPLNVTIVDPGHLSLRYYGSNVAFVSGSEVGFIRFSDFEINTTAVWRRLYADEQNEFSRIGDARVQTIVKTLRKMRELAHGGALLVVPKRKKMTRTIRSISYPSPQGFAHVSKELYEYNHGPDEHTSRYVMIDHYANMLGHLTAVDGATVITRDIELIGFGAILKPTRLAPTIYRTHPIDHPGWWKPAALSDLGNMRHQSAAQFVIRQKDSVAFVVSQDGHITSFVWMEKDGGSEPYLLVDSRLDLTLF